MDVAGLGPGLLLGRETGEQDLHKLLVHEGERVTKLGGIGREGELLGCFCGGKRHLGLARQHVHEARLSPMGRDGRGRGVVDLDAVGARALHAGERRIAGHQLVDDARSGVDVDRRRATQREQPRQVVGEHLGRGVGHRGAAQRRVGLGERARAGAGRRGRARGGVERRGRAEVDEAEVELPLLHLLLEGEVARADHDVGGRDVAVDDARAHERHAAHEVEQVAPDAGGHERREPPGAVNRKQPGGAGQRHALDPLHDDRGRAVHLAPGVEARKSPEPGERAVALVLLAEGRDERGARRRVAVGREQRLEREDLALGVRDAHDAAQAALPARGVVGEQQGESAQVGGPLGLGERHGRLERRRTDEAQLRLGRGGERLRGLCPRRREPAFRPHAALRRRHSAILA